ncbi:unnamed protein product [Aphanomyces euteiches]
MGRVRAMTVPLRRQYGFRSFQMLRQEHDKQEFAKLDSNNGIRTARIDQVVASARKRRVGSSSPQKLKQSVFAALFVDLPSVEKQALAQLVDADFVQTMKARLASREALPEDRITAHFSNIFHATPIATPLVRPIKHSLGNVLLEFARVFHTLYMDFVDSNQKEDIVDRATADVREFSELMVQVVKFKYPFLPPDCSNLVEQAVEDALFVHLQPTLHGLFMAQHRGEDAELASQTTSLRQRADIMDLLEMEPLFRLNGSSSTVLPTSIKSQLTLARYAQATALMNDLPARRSPSQKIECIAQVCHCIDDSIKAFYATHPNPPPLEKLHITADALVPVLAYVVVMAGPIACHHLASHIALMDAFLPHRLSAGHGAFSLTMLHGAIIHLQSVL